MATINEMRQVATQIENETQVGGNTASRVGGLFNDVVDKLEEVGLATVLDDVPTSGSQKGVKSGGVYDAITIGEILDVIDLPSLPAKNGLMANATQWIIPIPEKPLRSHVTIPVNAGEYYQITANGNNVARWAFLTTDQVPTTNLETIACVSGTTSMTTDGANSSSTFQIPVGCNYLAINKTSVVTNDFLPSSLLKTSGDTVSIKDKVVQLTNEVNALDKPQPFYGPSANWDVIKTDAIKNTLLSLELLRGELPNGSYIKYLGGRSSVIGQFAFYVFDSNGDTLSKIVATIPTDGAITTLYSSGLCTFKLSIDGSKMNVNSGSSFYDWTASSLILNENYLRVNGTPKRIVCFGDSITQFLDTEQSLTYPDYLARLSGCDVFNAGIGGTRLARRATPTTPISTETQAWAAVDISNLVSAWINNDWTIVDAAVTWLYNQNHSHDYRAKVATLKTINPSNVDIVTIFGGTNDFTGDSKLGIAGSTAIDEIAGALEIMFNLIQTANPAIEIFEFTPIVRYITNPRSNWSDTYVSTGVNLTGKKLPDIADFIESICQYYHVPCKNWYWDLGWNQFNFNEYFNTNDGTHPYKGMDYIGEKMYLYLKTKTKFTK